MKTRLIIGVHNDDIIMGMGGTLLKTNEQYEKTYAMILCRGRKEDELNQNERVRIDHENLNNVKVNQIYQYAYNDLTLDKVDNIVINKEIEILIESLKPDEVYVIDKDNHFDHKIVYNAVKIACRPQKYNFIKSLYSYILPLANNMSNDDGCRYVDISSVKEDKRDMLYKYTTENINMYEIETSQNMFGLQSGYDCAEKFKLLYQR